MRLIFAFILSQSIFHFNASTMCSSIHNCRDCVSNALRCTFFVPVNGSGSCDQSLQITGEFEIVVGFGDGEICPNIPATYTSTIGKLLLFLKSLFSVTRIFHKSYSKSKFIFPAIMCGLFILSLLVLGFIIFKKNFYACWTRIQPNTNEAQPFLVEEMQPMHNLSMETII